MTKESPARHNQAAEDILGKGVQLAKAGHIHDAIPHFADAIRLAPSWVKAYKNLALAYRDIRNYEKSITIAQQGLAIDPEHGPLLTLLSDSYRHLKQTAKAIEYMEKALAVEPENPVLVSNMAILHFDNGDKDNTLKYSDAALKMDPQQTQAHYFKARSKLYKTHTYPHLQSMIGLSESGALSDNRQLAQLHFGIAKAFDDLNDYKSAFSHYKNGNALTRATYEFDISQLEQKFEAITNFYNRDFLEQYQIKEQTEPSPLFIVGMPRSGTSLVEQILASHHDVDDAGQKTTIDEIGMYIDANKHNLSPQLLGQCKTHYMQSLQGVHSNSSFITDKMPMNFAYIGLIKTLFPAARIIHCRRNPRDTAISIFRMLFGGHLPYAYDLTEIAHYYALYKKQIEHWTTMFPDDIYTICYEKLVHDQEAETRKLLAFCGLEWDEKCLSFYKHKRSVFTASSYQVVQPVYKSAINSWKNYEEFSGDALVSL